MGDRAQVQIVDEGIYLYTHWGAYDLPETVRAALSKRWRWDDPEYLARIIFCEMVKGEEMSETGFGIGTEKHGDIWRLVKVDCENKTVTVIDNGKPEFTGTFETFIGSV